jgi:hypothetical protein
VSVDHSLRQAHEANRSESARLVRAVGREEERARLVADAKWERRVQAVVSKLELVEDPDFPGCYW